MVKVFIASATGKQPSATARALLKEGHEVHALVRSPDSEAARALKDQGAVLFKGDLGDLDSIQAAMAGTSAAFWIPIIVFDNLAFDVEATDNVVAAAKASGTVRKLVYSSVLGMDRIERVPGWDSSPLMKQYYVNKLHGEARARDSGLKYTILRPGEFMSNFLSPTAETQFPDLVREGVWRTGLSPAYRNKFVDVDDIGRVAAAALADPDRFHGAEMDLATDRLGVAEMIGTVSEVLGKKLDFRFLSHEETLEAVKTNPIMVGHLTRMAVAKAFPEGQTDTLDDHGFGFTKLRDFLERNKEALRETYKNVPQA
ncbi:NAD(P)-binding protein [Xylariomycetidae sp. FL2044]|nr:NAD(P)-binding protein [Xylariomycetidae sp. FL2044]